MNVDELLLDKREGLLGGIKPPGYGLLFAGRTMTKQGADETGSRKGKAMPLLSPRWKRFH